MYSIKKNLLYHCHIRLVKVYFNWLVQHCYFIHLATFTIVSRASAHGYLQLNHQNLGVGSYLEGVLE